MDEISLLLDRAVDRACAERPLPPVEAVERAVRHRDAVRVVVSLTVMVLVVAVSLVGLAGVGFASDGPAARNVSASSVPATGTWALSSGAH